jgi:hypothetical protein
MVRSHTGSRRGPRGSPNIVVPQLGFRDLHAYQHPIAGRGACTPGRRALQCICGAMAGFSGRDRGASDVGDGASGAEYGMWKGVV